MAVSVWVMLLFLVPVRQPDAQVFLATEQRAADDNKAAEEQDSVVELLQRVTQDAHADTLPEGAGELVVVYGEDGTVVAVHDHPEDQRIRPLLRRYSWSKKVIGGVPSVFLAFAVAGILFLGYLFLDASTRGHFTWSLRITCLLTFVSICVMVATFGNLW